MRGMCTHPPSTVVNAELQTCRFSATIAVFLVNLVIHVNRVEPESFVFGGGVGSRIAKNYWIILIIDISLGQSESQHLLQNLSYN